MVPDTPAPELDDDGLAVQKYLSRVLVVLPPEGFGDQILRYARSSLYNVHVGTVSTAADPDREVKGRLQDEFLVDEGIDGQDMSHYSGILIAGGEGSSPLAADAAVLDLVRRANDERKLVGTWGNGLEVLIRAGAVRGRRVTGPAELEAEARSAGAKFTGREIEASENLVTARDEGAGMRFGQALAEFVRI